MRILFMGTPDIAATCLEALLQTEHTLVGAVCQPDKPAGRGHNLTPPPVKVLAESHNLSVYQPEKIRTEEFETLLKSLNLDLIVVVAYGKILPAFVLNTPKYGAINVHVSLLPKWRGAAPMQRAIMAGDTKTGITILQMDEGLDTGDILLQKEFPIEKEDNFGTIHDKSAALGAELLPIVLHQIETGTTKPIKQNDSLSCYSPKIEKAECEIQFDRNACELDPYMRGLTPIPLPFTYLPDGRMLKVTLAKEGNKSGEPGTIVGLSDKGKGAIEVACKTGSIIFESVRPEGKGTMDASAFLRGTHLNLGEKLGR